MTSELQQQIEWRKSQVLELSSRGYTEREIASTLQVHCTTVHRDLVFLRKQAQQNLQRHIRSRRVSKVYGWNEAKPKACFRDWRNGFRS
jgi:transposase